MGIKMMLLHDPGSLPEVLGQGAKGSVREKKQEAEGRAFAYRGILQAADTGHCPLQMLAAEIPWLLAEGGFPSPLLRSLPSSSSRSPDSAGND